LKEHRPEPTSTQRDGGCRTERFTARLLSVVGIAATLLASTTARASPSSRLVYARGAGAESCPDEAVLRKAVAARLGFDPFFPTANLTILAEIEAATKGFRGRIQVMGVEGHVQGQRVVKSESADCAEMVRAMGLAISIAVDDLDLEPHPPPPPEPSRPPEPPPTAQSPLPASREPAVRPVQQPPQEPPDRPPPPAPATTGRATSYEAGLSVLGSVNTAPSPAFGVAASIGLRWRALGFALEGRYDPSASLSLRQGGTVWSSLAVGTALACLHGRLPFACITGSLGSFWGGGAGIASARSGEALLAAVGARAGVHLPVAGPFFAEAHLDVAYTYTPIDILVDGGDVYPLPPFSASLGGGGGVRF
jgi:hypothetical protein